MENPIKIDDLGGCTPIFWNTHRSNLWEVYKCIDSRMIRMIPH